MFKLKSQERPRSIRIFISSTFEDMKREREQLVKHTFPQLRSLARARGVEITEVDLRWGIDGEKVERGDTIAVCINEIERSRPYFIGILGHRYGWVPYERFPGETDAGWEDRIARLCSRLKREEYSVYIEGLIRDGKSATDIEFQHGVLRSSEARSRARVYLRRSSTVCDPDGSTHAIKMEALKKAVNETLVENEPEEYEKIEELHDLVLKDFKDFLDEDYPEDKKPNELHTILSAHKAFARTRLSVWEGAADLLDEIENASYRESPHLIITGPGGLGKTALIANWIAQRQDYGDDVFYLFCGGGPGVSKWDEMMRLLLEQIIDYYSLGEKFRVPASNEDLPHALTGMLSSFLQDKELIIVADGLDQLEDAGDMHWWPEPGKFPPGVITVLGVRSGATADILTGKGFHPITMKPLEVKDRKVIIRKVLKNYSRSLGNQLIDEIANDKESGNPLVLRTLLEELKAHGDYRNLDECIHWYIDTDSNEAFFSRVIERLSRDYEAASAVLPLIAASVTGLSETEIRDIAGLESHLAWSELYDVLAPHLANRDGYLVYSHDFISQAVARHFFREKGDIRLYQQKLAAYFHDPQRRFERHALLEWPELFARMGQVEKLLDKSTICSLYDYNVDQENPRLVNILETCVENGGDIIKYLKNRVIEISNKEDIFAEDRLAVIPFLLKEPKVTLSLLKEIWSAVDAKDTKLRRTETESKHNWCYKMKVLLANNIAVFEAMCGNHQQSTETMEHSIELSLEFGSKVDIAQRVHNYSGVLASQGDFMHATILADCAIDLYTASNDPKYENRLYHTLYETSLMYWEKGEFEKALRAMKKAYEGMKTLYGKDHPASKKAHTLYHSCRVRADITKIAMESADDIEEATENIPDSDIAENRHENYSEKAWLVYRPAKNLETAKKLLEMAIKATEGIPGFNDSIARIRHAVVLHAMGEDIVPAGKLEKWMKSCDNEGMVKQAKRLIKLSEDPLFEKKSFVKYSLIAGKSYLTCGFIDKGMAVLKNARIVAKNAINEGSENDSGFFRDKIKVIEEVIEKWSGTMSVESMESSGMINKVLEKRKASYEAGKSGFDAHNYTEACVLAGKLPLARKLEEEALKSFKNSGNMDAIARAFGNLGRICRLEKKYAQSMEYHNKEESIAMDFNLKDVFAESVWNQSITLRREGHYTKAAENAHRGCQDPFTGNYAVCCRIEELFCQVFAGRIKPEESTKPLEDELNKLKGNFAQGHWLGSAYLACILRMAGQEKRAKEIWNDIAGKAKVHGFKLIEMEMEELRSSGIWK